ncbi:uncharacterized protein EV154DRAFT_599149 [Mucor mucedo]|uniref:uncharacterized protein n=1 Tax=Mucor mucedo TaxID=29922 RepID=UPI00221EA337|nr:uncharacterized protein EV154DRAFT_599149 [Mucor mucedo]KAI7895551.1 hypothetical protein EV154DRAFT_599149 [Mucor mucedo]
MQSKKVNIGVEKLCQGPNVVSTITEEGERLVAKFLEDSSVAVHFRNEYLEDSSVAVHSRNEFLEDSAVAVHFRNEVLEDRAVADYLRNEVCIENGADDNRIFSRFYQEVNWFSLVEKLTGENSRENRVKLYDWVHVKGNNDEVIYDKIFDWTRLYFAKIQTILADPTQDYDFYRLKVMETTAMDIQTTGLSCLSDESCKKYADTWARLVVMIIRAVDGRNVTFSDFGRVCLTREMEDSARQFLNCIKLEVVGNSGTIWRKIQEFFLFLVCLPNPPGHERHKSMITLFMAFSQISHDGQWKHPNAASVAPARLRYCMRSIILKEIIDQESQ